MTDGTTRNDGSTRRRAMLALALVVPWPIIGVLFAMIISPGTLLGKGVFAACKVMMFAVPTYWYFRVERRRLSWSPVKKGGFGAGAALGLLISAVIVVGYLLVGTRFIDIEHAKQTAIENGIGTVPTYIAVAIYWITINSLLEEYMYRWFCVEHLEQLVSSKGAILLSALFFTLHHIIALKLQFDWTVTILGSAGVFIGGALWSWLYAHYRSIWPAYLSHAIVDIAVFGVGAWIFFGG